MVGPMVSHREVMGSIPSGNNLPKAPESEFNNNSVKLTCVFTELNINKLLGVVSRQV